MTDFRNQVALPTAGPSSRFLGPLLAIMGILLSLQQVSADDVSARDPFIGRLSAAMDSTIDGKPFREALIGIAKNAQLNVCLDRRVDPSVRVTVGSVGPTVYTAIAKLAASQDCVAMPVANVLLVGRESWVDQTAASILSLKLDFDNQKAVADIAWPILSTPTEAIRNASASQDMQVTPALPHDLWPATHWGDVDRRAAVTLVLAQFDQRPQSAVSLAQLRTESANKNGRFKRKYTLDKSCLPILRSSFTRVDRNGKVKPSDGEIVADGTVTAHRIAFDSAMKKLAESAKTDPNAKFTVKLEAIASEAFQQLAAKIGKVCIIEDAAKQSCQAIVKLQGEFTVKSLIEAIAVQADVKATWTKDGLRVTK
ncbi:MAG: hypothetical protein AB8B91_04325 [Rubripirellula sp.]